MQREGIVVIPFYNQDTGTVTTQSTVSVCLSVAGRLCMANCGRTSRERCRPSENILRPFLSSAPKANMAEGLTLIPSFKALSKLHLRAARGGGGEVRSWAERRRGEEKEEEMKRVTDDYGPAGRKSGRK